MCLSFIVVVTGLVYFLLRLLLPFSKEYPHTSRFVQPDYWNFKNTYLPTEIQQELMRFTGLNTNQLLRDPSQQLAYGYVSGNPLSWVDPFGLASCPTEQKPEYKQYRWDSSTGEMVQIDIVRQQTFDARPQDASGILATAAGADSISGYETTTKKEYANALAVGSLVVGGKYIKGAESLFESIDNLNKVNAVREVLDE